MLRASLALNAILAALVAAAAYLFVVRGSVAPGSDGRTAVIVAAGEKDLILGEMRRFLEAVQEIVESTAAGDLAAAGKAAHSVGGEVAEAVPPELMIKLPLEFKTLGLETHAAFDELSRLAAGPATREAVMAGLAGILNRCTTCHGGYRLEAAAAK